MLQYQKKDGDLVKVIVESEEEEKLFLSQASDYGMITKTSYGDIFSLTLISSWEETKGWLDSLVRLTGSAPYSLTNRLNSFQPEAQNIKPVSTLISDLIKPEDKTQIKDRHNRAMDVIVVKEVVQYFEEVDPALAEILTMFQLLGRRLNQHVMAQLEEREGV